MTRLENAIAEGHRLGKLALYFGVWDRPGHYLHKSGGRTVEVRDYPDQPWTESLMDGGLLDNGGHDDRYDGKVFWTVGGRAFWYAFFWWDRSGDKRGNSCSGFYVRGFGWPEQDAAFAYACAQFPHIVTRQKHPLIVQDRKP